MKADFRVKVHGEAVLCRKIHGCSEKGKQWFLIRGIFLRVVYFCTKEQRKWCHIQAVEEICHLPCHRLEHTAVRAGAALLVWASPNSPLQLLQDTGTRGRATHWGHSFLWGTRLPWALQSGLCSGQTFWWSHANLLTKCKLFAKNTQTTYAVGM